MPHSVQEAGRDLEAVKCENGQLKERMKALEKELGDVKTENRQLKPKMEKQVWPFN